MILNNYERPSIKGKSLFGRSFKNVATLEIHPYPSSHLMSPNRADGSLHICLHFPTNSTHSWLLYFIQVLKLKTLLRPLVVMRCLRLQNQQFILGKVSKKTFFWVFVPNYGYLGVQSPKLFSENNHSVIFTYF